MAIAVILNETMVCETVTSCARVDEKLQLRLNSNLVGSEGPKILLRLANTEAVDVEVAYILVFECSAQTVFCGIRSCYQFDTILVLDVNGLPGFNIPGED